MVYQAFDFSFVVLVFMILFDVFQPCVVFMHEN